MSGPRRRTGISGTLSLSNPVVWVLLSIALLSWLLMFDFEDWQQPGQISDMGKKTAGLKNAPSSSFSNTEDTIKYLRAKLTSLRFYSNWLKRTDQFHQDRERRSGEGMFGKNAGQEPLGTRERESSVHLEISREKHRLEEEAEAEVVKAFFPDDLEEQGNGYCFYTEVSQKMMDVAYPSAWKKPKFLKMKSSGRINPIDESEYEQESCGMNKLVYCTGSGGAIADDNTGGGNNSIDVTAVHAAPKRRKGKALVMYMMVGWEEDHRPSEYSNFIHLLHFGLHLRGQDRTQLFDGIDYVIYRINPLLPKDSDPLLCAEYLNVKLYQIPQYSCDLCAHQKILKTLGFEPSWADPGQNLPPYDEWPYKQILFLNNGVVGPIFGPLDSHWLDVVSMAGQQVRGLSTDGGERGGGSRRRGQYWDEEAVHGFRVVSFSTISPQVRPHGQSYFISVPLGAMDYFYKLFEKSCDGKMIDCIVKGELHTIDPFLSERKDWKAFSFAQNLTVNYANAASLLAEKMKNKKDPNPAFAYINPCDSIFVKFGGQAWQNQPPSLHRAVFHLTNQMQHLSRWKQQGGGSIPSKEQRESARHSSVIRGLIAGGQDVPDLGVRKESGPTSREESGMMKERKCRFFRAPPGQLERDRLKDEENRRKASFWSWLPWW